MCNITHNREKYLKHNVYTCICWSCVIVKLRDAENEKPCDYIVVVLALHFNLLVTV